MGELVEDEGIILFESTKNVMNQFVEGFAHLNMSGGITHKLSKEEFKTRVIGVIMAQQFGPKMGLKKFREKFKQADTKELNHLHEIFTFVLMDPSIMTQQQKHKSMNLLIFPHRKV